MACGVAAVPDESRVSIIPNGDTPADAKVMDMDEAGGTAAVPDESHNPEP